jgi:hypothetical protein
MYDIVPHKSFQVFAPVLQEGGDEEDWTSTETGLPVLLTLPSLIWFVTWRPFRPLGV